MKIALGIEYNGSNYAGWQRQQHIVGIQNLVESAIAYVANQPCDTFCAGRTDAGVHATAQVVHFETDAIRSAHSWLMGINANLPNDIVVTWSKVVADDFHARFSATARRYRYLILNQKITTAILPNGVTHVNTILDTQLMQQAATYLLGEQDFSSFRSSQCEAKTPYRNIYFIEIKRQLNYIIIDVQANAFLHHMVRNIVGALITIGSQQHKPEWLKWLLQQKDRTLAPATAKANGLYLVAVDYPLNYDIPRQTLGPLFLA